MEEVKQEIETIEVSVDIKSSTEKFTITSVLDELEDVLESIGNSNSLSFESMSGRGDIPTRQDDKKYDDSVKDTTDLSCQDCVFTTNSGNILNHHRNYQHGTNLFVMEHVNNKIRKRRAKQKLSSSDKKSILRTCDLCSFQTHGLRNTITHYRSEHKGENVFKCDDCDYGSNWPANMKNHKGSVHELKTYQCDLCEHKSKWNTRLLEHKRETHGIFTKVTKFSNGNPVVCDLCDYEARTSRMLQDHKSKNHKQQTKKGKVKRSRKTYLSAELDDNLKCVDEDIDNVISVDERIDTVKSVNENTDAMKSVDGNTYAMKSLDGNVDAVKSVDENIDTVKYLDENIDTLKSADEIGENDASSIKLVEKSNSNSSFEDLEIVKSLPRAKNLVSHLFFCKVCDYKSNKSNNVKKHSMAIHEGIRYPCDQCDFKSSETGALKKHKRKKHFIETAVEG